MQFHPEFKSTPWNGHPLFNAFIKAAMDAQAKSGKKLEISTDLENSKKKELPALAKQRLGHQMHLKSLKHQR